MSDPPLTTCALPTALTHEERWHNLEHSGGALSWNGLPFSMHPHRCKCQGDDPIPHRHYPQYEGHPCARCTACNAYDPAQTPACGGKLRRLIAGGTGFVLNGSGWAKDGYR